MDQNQSSLNEQSWKSSIANSTPTFDQKKHLKYFK